MSTFDSVSPFPNHFGEFFESSEGINGENERILRTDERILSYQHSNSLSSLTSLSSYHSVHKKGGGHTFQMSSNLMDPRSRHLGNQGNHNVMNDLSEFLKYILSPQLGTFTGCFVPSLLQFLGVVYWIRLPKLVGYGGILGTLIAFIISYFISFISMSSFAALVSNEKIPHGPTGVYYVLSRATGSIVGGSLGILLFVANLLSAMYFVIGFGSVSMEFSRVMYSWNGTKWHKYAFDSLAWFLICIISILGKKIFTKALVFVFLALLISNIILVYSFFSNTNVSEKDSGISWITFQKNWSWEFSETFPTTSLISLTLPSSAAVLAGVNLSGDLKTPYPSYHRGTIISIIWTFLLYVMIILLLGSTTSREILQTESHYMAHIPKNKLQAIVLFSMTLIMMSSGIISLIGSARVLFSMSRDGYFRTLFFPFRFRIKFLSEPIVSILFVYLTVQFLLTIFVALQENHDEEDILALARFISTIYLLAYAFTNLTVFLLNQAGAPNFRPLYRFHYWPMNLCGFFICITIVFIVNTYYALAVTILVSILFLSLTFLAPKGKEWGNLVQAVFYHLVRKYLLLLDEENIKFWRLQLLLIIDETDGNDNIEEIDDRMKVNENIMELGNYMKKGGLYIIGRVLEGSFLEKYEYVQKEKHKLQATFREKYLKAFSQVAVANDLRTGIQQLILMSGLGHMRPNTVMMSMKCSDNEKILLEFAQSIVDIAKLGMNIIIHKGVNHPNWRSPEKITFNTLILKPKKLQAKYYIDIYPLIHCRLSDSNVDIDATISFIIQSAAILTKSHSPWTRAQLRVCSIIDDKNNCELETVYLKRLLRICRIPECKTKVIVKRRSQESLNVNSLSPPKLLRSTSRPYFKKFSHRQVNSVIKENCANTGLVIAPLPDLPLEYEYCASFIHALNELSEGFGENGTGIMMVYGSQSVISTVLE